eukprot:gene667-1073_t
MSAIALTVGLVAALAVTDVNAVVFETCTFADSKCKNVISCLRGPDRYADDDDAYEYTQTGGNDDPDRPGARDYKSCTDFGKASFQHFSDYNDDDFYTEKEYMKLYTGVFDCSQSGYSGYGSGKAAVEYTGARCVNDAGASGASFTGSSMAALFGLLCISLTLW